MLKLEVCTYNQSSLLRHDSSPSGECFLNPVLHVKDTARLWGADNPLEVNWSTPHSTQKHKRNSENMADQEMDTSGDAQSESVLSTRSLSYISNGGSAHYQADNSNAPGNNNNAPRPRRRVLVDEHGNTEQYYQVMQYMRDRGMRTTLRPQRRRGEQWNDTDSDMEDSPDIKEEEMDEEQQEESLPTSVANSLLFSLPREIRDRIYGLCLHSRDSLPIEWPRLDRHNPYNIQPQLLRLCKIIHEESAPLLYTLNNLTFHHPSDSNVFVRALCDTTYGKRITGLSLHVKATDIRMWMAYLTSTDPNRSLRNDFPALRELGLRYRSSRWNARDTPEANLKNWVDDPRLDELIDGVRGVYRPYWCTPAEENLRAEEELELSGFDPHNIFPEPEFSTAKETQAARERYFELQHARLERARQRDNSPTIRICCACRVHPSHFQALTDPSVLLQSGPTNGMLPDLPPVERVVEGQIFPEKRGFTPIDLQRDVKKLYDPELGSANVSRTPYVMRKGVLLALEIHSVDSRREQ